MTAREEEVDESIIDLRSDLLKREDFIPHIFEGTLQDLPIKGFNGILIRINGQIHSDLDWTSPREQAKQATERGLVILWEIDLGLFHQLSLPLNNQTQFNTLSLAIDHFKSTLWTDFASSSLGLCVYSGSLDFSSALKRDHDLFEKCKVWSLEQVEAPNHAILEWVSNSFFRNVALDYLNLLAGSLPDHIPCYLCLNGSGLDALSHLLLLNPEGYGRFNLILKNIDFSFRAWSWDSSEQCLGYLGFNDEKLSNKAQPDVGVCIPRWECIQKSVWDEIGQMVQSLILKQIDFRVIPEAYLVNYWDGLDFLMYSPSGLTYEGRRKVAGFCAAGGRPVSFGKIIGFPEEMIFDDFLFKRSLRDELNRIHFKTIDSTNIWVKANLNLLDKTKLNVISAEYQTDGVGRYHRKWESPPNVNVYLTFCFFLKTLPPYSGQISQLLALSTVDILKDFGFDPLIKWPNDLMLNKKKLGGILAEIVSSPSEHAVIAGIGLNVNMAQEDLGRVNQPSTSLSAERGILFHIDEIQHLLIESFQSKLLLFLEEGFSSFQRDFQNFFYSSKGDPIRLNNGLEIFEGIFQSINSDGSIAIRLHGDVIKSFHAGEFI